MDARDFRSIGRAAQEELRRRALYLVEQAGMTQAAAAQVVGVQRQTVNIWLQRYREAGEAGVLDGRRVSPRRGKGHLTPDEARQVRGWIVERTPARFELPFGLMDQPRGARVDRAAPGQAARPVDGAALPAALGLPPAAAAGAGQRAPARGHRRLAGHHLPGACQAGRASSAAIPPGDRADGPMATGAVIYWGDETGISNHHAAQPHDPTAQLARGEARAGDRIGRSYAPKGRTPVIARTAERITQRMISAVSNRGLMRFMLHRGALNADGFIAFLRRLIRDAGQKVILIVDNPKVHKAGKVQVWVASHAHEIELRYLPSYAPDHNPSEHLNNDLKQQLRRQRQPGSEEELIERTRSVLRAIQRSPERIQGYFKPKPVRYAA